MAIFKTNFEVILAREQDIEMYYTAAAQKISLLLEKYDIRDVYGKFEVVSPDKCRTLLSPTGFFQSTPLKSIFFDQKRPFIPQEIILAFRSIISDPPISIKAVFLNTFIDLLAKKGWGKPLSTYFETQYNIPHHSVIILDDLKDFSLGSGVYRAAFRTPHKEKIIVFLKGSRAIDSYNELLYFHLQKALLSTATHVKLPYRLSNRENQEELLLSPLISGVSSDTTLSIFTRAYQETQKSHHKSCLKKALKVLIEAFMHHAALGDLLGRNDRHLMNSLVTFVTDGVPHNNILEDLNNAEKILAHAETIIAKNTEAISLIDIDLKWLLEEKNANWILADIDFGQSELNLLSLLAEFNDCCLKTNLWFEKRKETVVHYFNVYCQKQAEILEKKELLFSAIKKIYPANIAEKKLKFLTQSINDFEKSKAPVVKLFKRYLLDFRIRLVHKKALIALDEMSKESNDTHLLNALKDADLLKHLPPTSAFAPNQTSVLLQLQCFRGVLSNKDRIEFFEKDRESWESVAANISIVSKKFNGKLFQTLEDEKQFIKEDATVLLKWIQCVIDI